MAQKHITLTRRSHTTLHPGAVTLSLWLNTAHRSHAAGRRRCQRAFAIPPARPTHTPNRADAHGAPPRAVTSQKRRRFSGVQRILGRASCPPPDAPLVALSGPPHAAHDSPVTPIPLTPPSRHHCDRARFPSHVTVRCASTLEAHVSKPIDDPRIVNPRAYLDFQLASSPAAESWRTSRVGREGILQVNAPSGCGPLDNCRRRFGVFALIGLFEPRRKRSLGLAFPRMPGVICLHACLQTAVRVHKHTNAHTGARTRTHTH